MCCAGVYVSKDIKADKFAVIFLQFQNEFLSPKGIFYGQIRRFINDTNMIEKSIIFLNDIRALKGEIIFINSEFPEHAFNPNSGFGILKPIFAKKALMLRSIGSAAYAGFEVRYPSIEACIGGKNGVSGFKGTNLHDYLQKKGITHLGVCGFLSNCCVDSTLRDAFDLGYQTYSIIDCQATFDIEAHRAAQKYSHPNFSELIKSEQFISLLHENKSKTFVVPGMNTRFSSI